MNPHLKARPPSLVAWRVTGFVGLALLSGCANTKAVSSASTQLVSASSAWDQVSGVPATSCSASSQLSTISTSCQSQQQLTDGMRATTQVLIAYFNALGQASDTKNFVADQGLTTLGASAAEIPNVGDKATAVAGLATFLLTLYEGHERDKLLRRLIIDGGPKARSVIDVLHDVVVPDLNGIVDGEQTNLDAAYDEYVGSEHSAMRHGKVDCSRGPRVADFPASEPNRPSMGTALLLAGWYCQRVTGAQKNRELIQAYAESLASAETLIKSLEDNRSALGERATIEQLFKISNDLASKVGAMKKAF